MNRPKYTENPMACLRDIVAGAVHNRLARLKRKADDAERLARIARDELESSLAEAEAGTFNDVDCVAICTGDSDCWAEVCRRVKEIDNGEQWGPLSQRVHTHASDREDYDVALVTKIFPDFNPAPGIREGLARFQAGK
jgi:hypothetical protein